MPLSWRILGRSNAMLLIAWLAVGAPAPAAVPVTALEIGLPLLRNFTPREYGASAQNWAIVQDPRGLIYVGNNDGVLEFDGVRWRVIPVANSTLVRSLAVDDSGRIYVGAYGELGALETDAMGQTQYVSWMDRIPPEERGFGQVLQTFATTKGIVFSSSRRIFRVGDKVQIWKPRTAFDRVLKAGERLFVREEGRGLMELMGDEWQMLPGGERFADENVYELLPWDGTGSFLIGTRAQGLFRFDGTSFHPFPTAVDAFLKRDLLRSAVRLADGSLALATIQNGLYLLDAQGRFRTHLTTGEGLQNDIVIAMLQDREGGLWMALNKGIARAEPGGLTTFTKGNGLDSTVISMHRQRGSLFIGVNNGLSRLVRQSDANARFVSVPEIKSQTWAFLDAGSGLLVANAAGVYEIQDDLPKLVRPSTSAAMALGRSKRDPLRVFVGLQNGLGSMRWEGRRWVDEGKVPGIADQVRSLMETADGRLWGGAYSAGVFRVTFPTGTSPEAPAIERFGVAQGLPDLKSNDVVALDGNPVFATVRGLFRFDEATRRFVPDPRFVRLFPEGPRWVGSLTKDRRGWIWMVSTDEARHFAECGAAVPNSDGSYHWESRPLRALLGSPVQTIHCDDDGVIWFGGFDGLFRYDSRIPTKYNQPFAAFVRKVTGPKDKLFFGGTGPGTSPKLAYADNGLRFEFAAPSFAGLEANRFQTRLEGEEQDWSPWSTETYRVYSSLSEGGYKFHVRARNTYGIVSEEGSFSFTILPPWYRTWWAYGGYLLLLGAAGEGLFLWRVRALRRKTRLLEADIAERKRIQAALQASEEHHRAISVSANDAIITADAAGRIVDWNPAAERIFGYKVDEVRGEPLTMIIQPGDRDAKHGGMEGWLAGGDAHDVGKTVELAGRHRDGRALPLELSLARWKTEKGTFVTATIRDVTARQQAETKLRASEESLKESQATLRTLIDSTSDLVWSVDPVSFGLITFNERIRTHYLKEYKIPLQPGLTPSDLFPKREWVTLWEELYRRALREGPFVTEYVGYSGALTMELSFSLLRRDSRLFGIAVFGKDITEKKKAERALRQSEERYRLLFENNPLAMWIHDLKSLRFLAVNESAVQRYGYTREEFLSISYQHVCHADDLPLLFKWIAEDRAEGGSSVELRHRRKDGTIIHVEAFSKPLSTGGSGARLVLVNDVTERRLIQEQLLHAQRLESVGMLAAGIAHDLNNVLAPIMMAAPMLRKNLSAPRDLKMLDTIEQSATRGAGLVKQILGFMHSTSGEFQPTQVKHLARDVINVIEETFPKSIQLEHTVPRDLWLVSGNASQIHQVLLNLCVNARDAMPQGGTLRIVAANRRLDAAEAAAIPGAQPGAWLMLEVADSGTGIPPEVMEKIWTPFFTTKEIGKGTGLGLSTVRSIVLGHHGFIELETEVGRGSTFRVFLPVAANQAAPAMNASLTRVADGNNEMVLVVDDSASIRDVIIAVVEESGYRAVGCADGMEAIAQFAAQPDTISLVITDVDMPRLGGVGLAQAVLKMRPDIRILALSGQSNSSDNVAGIQQIQTLAHEFLHKPFKPEELLAAIRRVLHAS